MMDQLPIFQEIEYFLEDERLIEISERVAHKMSPSGDIAAIKAILPLVFAQLKRGILYTYERYGKVAEQFTVDGDTYIHKIGNDEGYTINYIPELDCIAIDYMSLGVICTSIMNNRKGSIVPIEYWGTCYKISIKDAVFLGGVEEAYHAYYIKSGGSYKAYWTLEEYKSDPAELAAGKVIRQAIREQGIQLYIFINGQCFPCGCPEGDVPA